LIHREFSCDLSQRCAFTRLFVSINFLFFVAFTVSAATPSSSGNTVSEDGQWVRAAKDFASTRFSALDQITAKNIKQLKLAWSFSTGTDRGLEAAPLVVGATMYIVTPYPNIVYALDLDKPGVGQMEV